MPEESLSDRNPPGGVGLSSNAQSNSSKEKAVSLEPQLATDDPYLHEPPRGDTSAPGSEAWTAFVNVGRAYDKDVCSAWKDQIDNLLLFASLFSAVVTSFIIESYKLLKVDHQELTSAVLLGVHNQLDSILRQGTFVPPLVPDPTPHFTPSSSAIAINMCLFLSLMLSLSTVSVGILCLQWLREYAREPDVSLKHIIAIRHFRLRGLEDWWVAEIIGLLPLMLQISLFLFFIGLALFLLNTNETVAIPVCCLIGITVLILVATSIIPAFHAVYAKWENTDDDHSMCPYRSPQAWVIRRGFLATSLWIVHLLDFINSVLSLDLLQAERPRLRPSTQPDLESPPANGTNDTIPAVIVPSGGWLLKIAQQFRPRVKAKDWHADDVRHVTSTRPSSGSSGPSFLPARWYKGVAWELASVPKTHLHNVQALCAFVRCIGDMDPDQWALMLEGMGAKQGRDRDLVGMLRKTSSSPSPENASGCVMGQNLTLAFTLDHLAENNVQFRWLTINYRFELVLRMLCQYAKDFMPPTDDDNPPENKSTEKVESPKKEGLNDTSDRARWWALVQQQMLKFTSAYRFHTKEARDLIPPSKPLSYYAEFISPDIIINQTSVLRPPDLQTEAFKVVYQYVDRAPFVLTEYVLGSCPLAKHWFFPHPPPEVIRMGELVNERMQQLIAKGEDSNELRITLNNAFLYAVRIKETHIRSSKSFVPLVLAIAERKKPISTPSTVDQEREPLLMDSKTYKKQWDALIEVTDASEQETRS
ncbi:hypothetical protein EST38_g4513 [Candolleomyces aberdarensis]|uniref:DUF6535 domain-containing protein n=1 Tax=Candolleomyces aberdarensis TaxID=2316362 RepID=A0A4Q2DQR4_9AGAR|nr:hypothetical protein EST38_g4513 [Candolleomyces aberdarensis]